MYFKSILKILSQNFGILVPATINPKTPLDAGLPTLSPRPAQTTPPEDGLTLDLVTTNHKTPLDAGLPTPSPRPAQTTLASFLASFLEEEQNSLNEVSFQQ